MKVRFAFLGLGLLLFCGIVLLGVKRSFVQPDDAGLVELQEVPSASEAEVNREAVEDDVIEEPEAPVLTSLPLPETAACSDEADAVLSEGNALSENPDYRGGNGTILTYAESDWVRKIIRKCEMDVTIGGMLDDEGRTVYESIAKKSAVGLLQDGDRVSVLQICTLEYLQEPEGEYGSEKGDLWFKISQDGTEGWICVNDGYLFATAPYYGNSWEVLGTIRSQGKSWTVRSMRQSLSVFEKLPVWDRPGTGAGSLVYTIVPGEADPVQTDVQVTAVTEEEDTVDGITDRWVKVSYKGHEGWIFGGYASAQRGGPKYYIPEQWIAFDLGTQDLI